jgi:hypothetical protein
MFPPKEEIGQEDDYKTPRLMDTSMPWSISLIIDSNSARGEQAEDSFVQQKYLRANDSPQKPIV